MREVDDEQARLPSDDMPVYGNPYPDAFVNLPAGCGSGTVPKIDVIDLCDWSPEIPDPDVAFPSRRPVVVPTVPSFSDPCLYIQPNVNVEYTDRKGNDSYFKVGGGGSTDCTDGRYVMKIDVPIKCPIPESIDGTSSDTDTYSDGVTFVGENRPSSTLIFSKSKTDCSIDRMGLDLRIPCVFDSVNNALTRGTSSVTSSFSMPEGQVPITVSGSSGKDECKLDSINFNLVVPKGCMDTSITGKAELALYQYDGVTMIPDSPPEGADMIRRTSEFTITKDDSCGFSMSLPLEIPVPKVCSQGIGVTMKSLSPRSTPYVKAVSKHSDREYGCDDITMMTLGMPSGTCPTRIRMVDQNVEFSPCSTGKIKMFMGSIKDNTDGFSEKYEDCLQTVDANYNADARSKLLERKSYINNVMSAVSFVTPAGKYSVDRISLVSSVERIEDALARDDERTKAGDPPANGGVRSRFFVLPDYTGAYVSGSNVVRTGAVGKALRDRIDGFGGELEEIDKKLASFSKMHMAVQSVRNTIKRVLTTADNEFKREVDDNKEAWGVDRECRSRMYDVEILIKKKEWYLDYLYKEFIRETTVEDEDGNQTVVAEVNRGHFPQDEQAEVAKQVFSCCGLLTGCFDDVEMSVYLDLPTSLDSRTPKITDIVFEDGCLKYRTVRTTADGKEEENFITVFCTEEC